MMIRYEIIHPVGLGDNSAMKRFMIRLVVSLSVLASANGISLFSRSDDLFTPDLPDAMTRFGFPLLIYQDGGPVALCFLSHAALWGDVIIALALSVAAAACYPTIWKDILRTAGFVEQ